MEDPLSKETYPTVSKEPLTGFSPQSIWRWAVIFQSSILSYVCTDLSLEAIL